MFTPVETACGALLLHQATSVLLSNTGKPLGVSGMLRRCVAAPSRSTLAICFLIGMVLSFLPVYLLLPSLLPTYPVFERTWRAALWTVGIGALTGWGTKNSNGCTSGHMLSGLSHLSGRSALAVAIFFPTALLTSLLSSSSSSADALPPCASSTNSNNHMPYYTPSYPPASKTARLVLLVALLVFQNLALPRLLRDAPKSTAREAISVLSGLEFGLGLLISGMASPLKVVRFFALASPRPAAFNPSLSLILLFGTLPSLLLNLHHRPSRPSATSPAFDRKWHLPTKTARDVDWRFGVAWGLAGVCPGPAVLRAVVQPEWGVLWAAGFWAGCVVPL
ncbi:hypothetical protein B0A49_01891 [Cryomyces minteri]|uniref:Sulphur transport domain-containing protein n=1 Tax=Cryomyces minteri TaxID=331657 RepID=A0A4V5NI25_9PEZI|nr:hypothetical protein B0A49_01891 [Cryomyces minteri]